MVGTTFLLHEDALADAECALDLVAVLGLGHGLG
tara:strand:- start:369 stop:470 length:102 start_codon:yes stop_codon:yes gene_type:complete